LIERFKKVFERQNRYADYLFDTPMWQKKETPVKRVVVAPSPVTAPIPVPASAPIINEQVELLSSLKEFVKEAPQKRVEFPQGSLQIVDSDQGREWVLDDDHIPDSEGALAKVIFVTERLPLAEQSNELLVKMTKAMGLSSNDWVLLGITSEEELKAIDSDEEALYAKGLPITLSTIAEVKPLVVLALGATANRLMLSKKEKLSKIHGRHFTSKVLWNNRAKHHDFHLVPIFHPDFLLINPNMKRTAWDDLQGVMSAFLNKG